jgi:hypothetical protein
MTKAAMVERPLGSGGLRVPVVVIGTLQALDAGARLAGTGPR